MTPPSLDSIESDLRAPSQEVRCAAMQRLLKWATIDPAIRPAALPIFRHAVAEPVDPWATRLALDGIELIAGADEARRLRTALLAHPSFSLVNQLAQSLTDPAYAPALIDLLERRDDIHLRQSILRTLGRMRGAAEIVFPVLLKWLDASPNLRPHAIEALASLGDARAIPHLDPLRRDRTDAWPEDNHGPMLRVCDVATSAIERIVHENATRGV